ncbi:amidohydrolase family protein [Natrarchaeobius chitinivorans]|nr:amidohydrolase family protein [Natrarchaeobius chitinivorans]
MKIDAFTHVLTERFYETLLDEHGFQGLSGSPSFLWDLEQRLEDMDEYGIDKQVLTIALPPIWQGMDDETALELTKLANDEIRHITDEHPDRFVPVGTIPKVNDEFIDEFDRCVNDLEMAGIQIFSNIDGEPLDRPQFDPLFAKADAEDAPLWLHPQIHEWYDWASEYMDHRLFGWPFDTTLALSRLVFGGVTQKHDFDVVAHHGGGMIPYYSGRIDGFYETRQQYPENYADTDLPDLEQPVSDHFAEFYTDACLGSSVAAHECAYDFFGDTLIYGTDYPFGPGRGRTGIETGIDAVESMDIDDEAREGIYAENLLELID